MAYQEINGVKQFVSDDEMIFPIITSADDGKYLKIVGNKVVIVEAENAEVTEALEDLDDRVTALEEG